MSDELEDKKTFVAFDKKDELEQCQADILSKDWRVVPSAEEDKHEAILLDRTAIHILLQYQEQSYLLDPYLESLVTPLVDWLKSYARDFVQSSPSEISAHRIERVALLLYNYIKFRGYKTIIRFFPHEVGDLTLVLNFVNDPSNTLIHDSQSWALRYVILLWLSLICMLPFDLAQFDAPGDSGSTLKQIEQIAKSHLGKAGIEREGAALLLSRLYMRKDASSDLDSFIQWASETVLELDNLTAIGMLHVLCEVAKSAPGHTIQPRIHDFLPIITAIESSTKLNSNTLLRKYSVKLMSRLALRTLPGVRRRRSARTLDPLVPVTMEIQETTEEDVSEIVETALERVFNALQDRDTIVRWSAAKGVARLAERLPFDFLDQVVDTVLNLFTIHSIAGAAMYELPAIAESTWHGAALACAELSRRGVIQAEKLTTLVDWMLKALYFDLRKGAHSIGSNVRDAAAYTIWALARVQDPSVLAPHAESLSKALVTVALFDREVQIRRAASAAFQEHVGRTNLFAHGIDVLRKTDFYAVSIRKNSFLVAAPQVAEHEAYRGSLLDHLLDVTLRHWDANMRRIGSESLRQICLLDLGPLAKKVKAKAVPLLLSVDVADVHGAILGLTELALAYRQTLADEELEAVMREIFAMLATVPHDTLIASRNGILIGEACRLIAVTITKSEIDAGAGSPLPQWRQIIENGIKHRTAEVQEEGAKAELRTGTPFAQQSLGRVLGCLAYDAFPNGLSEAVPCLLDCVSPSTTTMKSNVEARRNCYTAIPQIFATTISQIPRYISSDVANELFDALLTGLEDYTIDERGDVGSWIRIVSVQGLQTCAEMLITHSSSLTDFPAYLPPGKYHTAIGGILKQGVEKLDNVRFQAGRAFTQLLRLPLPDVMDRERWRIADEEMFIRLFESLDREEVRWNDGSWLFPRAVNILQVGAYRKQVLNGLILSLGSKTDVTQRNVSESLTAHVSALPVESSTEYDMLSLLTELLALSKGNLSSNAIIIPLLQTFNVLLASGALQKCNSCLKAHPMLKSILQLASRGVDRLKSVQRINECMKVVINLLPFSTVYKSSVPTLPSFLAHKFPVVRSDTAEKLYILLQSADIGRDTDEVEDILLSTEWSNSDIDISDSASASIVELLLE